MTKKEISKKIKDNAKEQIRIYENEIKSGISGNDIIEKYKGAIYGIEQFLINLEKIGIIS